MSKSKRQKQIATVGEEIPVVAEPTLREFVLETIRQEGPVTFAWFMEQALYRGEQGYYSSGRARIGRGGDYFTSVSVGPLFGRLLAVQFAELWERLGQPEEFTLVEQGAHGGEFAGDLLAATRATGDGFSLALRYRIVEPFEALRTRQRETLAEFGPQVEWYPSVAEMPLFQGAHFSNELLDAMPVHVVRWNGKEWLERHVGEYDGELEWVDLPLSDDRLEERLEKLPMLVSAGYETEVNLAAADWIETLAPRLVRGFLVAVDYGYVRDAYYAPHRRTGTLRSYAQHRVVESPLTQIGEADITAHVEWTSVAEQAERCGFHVLGFADQHHFITGLLAGEFGDKFSATATPKMQRALQTLLHPAHLGMKFQFLMLAKNVEPPPELSGLRYAKPRPQ